MKTSLRHSWFLSALLLVSLATSGFAYDNTWRGPSGLFSVVSSDTIGAGNFAISFYFNNLDREANLYGLDDEIYSLDFSYLTLPVAYGIMDRFEVSLAPSYHMFRREGINSDTGIGDIFLNFKASALIEEDMGFGLGGLVYAKLPTADEEKGLGTGEADYGIAVLGSKHFDKLGLHLNVGYTIIGEPDGADYDDQLNYGLGMDYNVLDNLAVISELTGETAYDSYMNKDPIDLLVGARYWLPNGLVLGGGVRYNLTNEDGNCPWGGIVQIGFSTAKRTVVPPAPKVVPELICEIESKEVVEGQYTRVKVLAKGFDTATLTYEWKTTGCKLEADGATAKFIAEGCAPGSYVITCIAKDGKGNTAECSSTAKVIQQKPEKKLTKLDLPLVPFKKGVRVDNVAKAILDDIAVKIKQYPDTKVTLKGYTDSQGSDDANHKIGLQRAENVKKYLVERHKIDAGRFVVESGGKNDPIGDNKTEAGRKMNRRVEVIMMVEQAAE